MSIGALVSVPFWRRWRMHGGRASLYVWGTPSARTVNTSAPPSIRRYMYLLTDTYLSSAPPRPIYL